MCALLFFFSFFFFHSPGKKKETTKKKLHNISREIGFSCFSVFRLGCRFGGRVGGGGVNVGSLTLSFSWFFH
jgi:hypothetical protein